MRQQPMQKPTLYALLSSKGRIDAAAGDSINELRTLGTLSTFFDVYYNNEPFSRTKLTMGELEVGPTREYDFYYIRGNPAVFSSISGKKISFAYPYNEETFKNSQAFIVLTENWKRHLLRQGTDSEQKLRDVYENIAPVIDAPILNVGQKIDPRLADAAVTEADALEMKVRLTGSHGVFGYYGNLNRELYPYRAFEAIERLGQETERPADPVIALAGKFRKNSEISYKNSLYLGSLPYEKMAALHTSTLANLTNESKLNHCLGNQKVIDSISRGVPVMCQKLDTFVEQLGEYYPCFYETANEAYKIARTLFHDAGFREYARSASLARAQYFRAEEVEKRFLAQDELQYFTA